MIEVMIRAELCELHSMYHISLRLKEMELLNSLLNQHGYSFRIESNSDFNTGYLHSDCHDWAEAMQSLHKLQDIELKEGESSLKGLQSFIKEYTRMKDAQK